MNSALATTRLHLNKREITFAVPLYIAGFVAIITVMIALVLLRAGGVPGTQEWIDGSRGNGGMVWGVSGFVGYLGVQAVATTFPFAMTLGSTRRNFVLGTQLWAAITSAYLAAIYVVLCSIELATGHWFADFYILDVTLLGKGNLPLLALITFLGAWTVLSLGGMFAASWVRYRTRGPMALGAGFLIVLVAAALVLVPSFGDIIAAFRGWWLVVAALVTIGGSGLGTWAMLRTASVR